MSGTVIPAFGAARPVRDPTVAALLPEARATITRAARSFSLAARLLPPPIREDVELLYLVLRTFDDLVDRAGTHPAHAAVSDRLAAVEAWAAGLPLAVPVLTRETRILEELARRHPTLPRDAVTDFTAGMRQDLAGPVIGTEADLDRYGYRVAGTVGRLMAAILGADGTEADHAARSLGIAMQRTNILRDIDEDLARGRCYIPSETLAAHGIDGPLALRHADRRALLRDGIRRADDAYEIGIAGIGRLRHGRRSIVAAARLYREILRRIETDGLGARRPHRAIVGRGRRVRILVGALLGPAPQPPG